MASTPNSGSMTETEQEIELATVQPNSGLRHDFIGNSAFFATISDVPQENEVTLLRDNDATINNNSTENVQSSHITHQLPASSSVENNVATAQAQNTTVSAGQSNMADIRSILLNLVEQFSDNAPQQTHVTTGDSNNADCFMDNLDAITSNNCQVEQCDNIESEDIVLQQMNDFFKQIDKCGPEINADFAKAVCSGFRTKVSKDKRKELLELHSRPANCNVLKTPRVNKTVWNNMTRQTRDSGVSSQILQSNVCAVTYSFLSLIDKMHNAKRSNKPIFGNDMTKCLKLAMDSFKLVQLCFTDITYRRRAAIQPYLHKAYKDLCSEDTAVTDLLFGDNLDTRIKALTDAKIITDKLHQSSFRGDYRGSYHVRQVGLGRGQFRAPTPRFSAQNRFQPYNARGGRRPTAPTGTYRNTAPFLGVPRNSRPQNMTKKQKQ